MNFNDESKEFEFFKMNRINFLSEDASSQVRIFLLCKFFFKVIDFTQNNCHNIKNDKNIG